LFVLSFFLLFSIFLSGDNTSLFQHRRNTFFIEKAAVTENFFSVPVKKNLRRNCLNAESFCLIRIFPYINKDNRPLSKVKFHPIKSSEQLPLLKEV